MQLAWLPLFLLASGCAWADGDVLAAYRNLAEMEAGLEQVRQGGAADPVWERIKSAGSMPLVFGRTAVFLYRGAAKSVEWRGDFSDWGPVWNAAGERVGDSNIWRKTVQLLQGSRLDYRIVVDGANWMLDPLNPHRQVGGSGFNSEARMPDWQPSRWAQRQVDAPRGELSEFQVYASETLGYSVKYRVYTPPGISAGARNLRSIYVTDGPDYYRDDWGAMLTILDNLYAAGRIEPVIAVFVSQWNLEDTDNRRGAELLPNGPGQCDFCSFIVDELVARIETDYPVSDRGIDRAILGTSLGGLFATYLMLWHGEDFGKVAIQSPAYQYPPGRFIFETLIAAEEVSQQVFLDVGLYETDFMRPTLQVAAKLAEQEVDLLYVEVPDGHSWGHWRTTIDDMLLFFYGRDAQLVPD